MKILLALALSLAPATESRSWPSEVLELAASIPIQDEGRVKPLSTFAGFTLLRIHHKRTCADASGAELTAVAWMLDVLLFPEAAVDCPLFRVQSHEAVQALGLSTEGKKKRDLYTYRELHAGREKLLELSHTYSSIDAKKRSGVEAQVVNLGHAVHEFERLLHLLDFARADFDVAQIPFLSAQEPARPRRSFGEIVAAAPELVEALSSDSSGAEGLRDLLAAISPPLQSASTLRFFPPAESVSERAEWTSAGEVAADAFLRGVLDPRHASMVASLEGLVAAREEPETFQRHLSAFAATARELSSKRGEIERIDLEVGFYRLDPFYRSLVFYLLAFVLTALAWLRPRARWLHRGSLALAGAGLLVHATGIVLRCILRSRPPVSTLYETILFVTAIAVAAALFIELVDRRRIAGAMAPSLGALGLFIAMRFEELQGVDTMPQLVAVLDTNFWLATHVTCITMGYSAGLLASAFAHLYVLGRVFGVRSGDASTYRGLARVVYGTICFALVFSVVGTILGGVWANESWGRFWGWDPKENGALMIVLAQLSILHARMGGYIKAFGIAVAAILQGCVVAFSWWGVNLLGIGLHSYGFTDGIWRALLTFYGLEGAVLLGAMAWSLRGRFLAARALT